MCWYKHFKCIHQHLPQKREKNNEQSFRTSVVVICNSFQVLILPNTQRHCEPQTLAVRWKAVSPHHCMDTWLHSVAHALLSKPCVPSALLRCFSFSDNWKTPVPKPMAFIIMDKSIQLHLGNRLPYFCHFLGSCWVCVLTATRWHVWSTASLRIVNTWRALRLRNAMLSSQDSLPVIDFFQHYSMPLPAENIKVLDSNGWANSSHNKNKKVPREGGTGWGQWWKVIDR